MLAPQCRQVVPHGCRCELNASLGAHLARKLTISAGDRDGTGPGVDVPTPAI